LPRPPERIHHYRTVYDLLGRVLYKLATWPPEKLEKAFSKWKKAETNNLPINEALATKIMDQICRTCLDRVKCMAGVPCFLKMLKAYNKALSLKGAAQA